MDQKNSTKKPIIYLPPSPKKKSIEVEQKIETPKPVPWPCDPEFYSKYLIKKTELAAEYKTYLLDQPALRAILSDFIQKILFKKPKDIYEFGNEFFKPLLEYSPESPPSTAISSSSSSCYLSTTTAGEEEEEDKYLEEEKDLMENIVELHRKLFNIHLGGGDEARGEGTELEGEDTDFEHLEFENFNHPPPPTSPEDEYERESAEEFDIMNPPERESAEEFEIIVPPEENDEFAKEFDI